MFRLLIALLKIFGYLPCLSKLGDVGMTEVRVSIYFLSLSKPHRPFYKKLESCYHLGVLMSENTRFLYLETK